MGALVRHREVLRSFHFFVFKKFLSPLGLCCYTWLSLVVASGLLIAEHVH